LKAFLAFLIFSPTGPEISAEYQGLPVWSMQNLAV